MSLYSQVRSGVQLFIHICYRHQPMCAHKNLHGQERYDKDSSRVLAVMCCSLELPANCLPRDKFNYMDHCFSGYNAEENDLLRQKNMLIPILITLKMSKECRSDLEKFFAQWWVLGNGNSVGAFSKNVRHCNRSMEDYHDLYVKADRVILARIM